MIPLVLLGARQEDHTVNEYAEQDHREVRGLWGQALGTGANISAYNDVTFILNHWKIDWLLLLLLIQPVFILSGGVTQCQKKWCITYLLPVRLLTWQAFKHKSVLFSRKITRFIRQIKTVCYFNNFCLVFITQLRGTADPSCLLYCTTYAFLPDLWLCFLI